MSMKQGLSVLLTGVGAPGVRGTLYALRNNPDHVPVRVVGVDIQSNAVGRYMVDQFYQIHPPESDGYIDSLRAMCERENIDVVIPQTTREITLLSHQSNQLDTPVMVSDANVIEIANNKWELLKFFQKMQLPHPQFQLSRSKDELIEATRILGYPTQKVIVKPPVSNGMRGFRILSEDGWDVKRFLTEKPSGVEITLNSLIEILHRGTEYYNYS